MDRSPALSPPSLSRLTWLNCCKPHLLRSASSTESPIPWSFKNILISPLNTLNDPASLILQHRAVQRFTTLSKKFLYIFILNERLSSTLPFNYVPSKIPWQKRCELKDLFCAVPFYVWCSICQDFPTSGNFSTSTLLCPLRVLYISVRLALMLLLIK